MAIKGKTKSRSRRVVAVAPRPPVYVRKPPFWRRAVTWIIVGLLAAGGVTAGVLINLSHRHRTHLKETTLTAVRSFQNALNGKFPPSPDSRPSQPTGYVIYPTLGTDLADTASGKKKPADAESLGKSLAKSASASADAIQKLNVTQLIPESADYGPVASVHGVGATRLEMTAAQGLIVHAFRIYSSIGGLMEQAGQATSDKDRTALVNDAKELLTQAQALFNEGYQKITNVMGELSALQANPFPQQGGGLGG